MRLQLGKLFIGLCKFQEDGRRFDLWRHWTVHEKYYVKDRTGKPPYWTLLINIPHLFELMISTDPIRYEEY